MKEYNSESEHMLGCFMVLYCTASAVDRGDYNILYPDSLQDCDNIVIITSILTSLTLT